MVDPATRRTRRSVLTAGAAAAGALALQSVAASVGARAADGQPMILGTDNDAASSTGLVGTSGSGPALRLTQTNPAGGSALEVNGGVWVGSGGVLSHGGSGTGLSGSATTGTAVAASAEPGGVALRVNGRVAFSRSGMVVVKAGHRTATVRQIGLRPSSRVLATLQQHRAGITVAAAVPTPGPPGRIVIYLNRAVGSDTRVAWFVLD